MLLSTLRRRNVKPLPPPTANTQGSSEEDIADAVAGTEAGSLVSLLFSPLGLAQRKSEVENTVSRAYSEKGVGFALQMAGGSEPKHRPCTASPVPTMLCSRAIIMIAGIDRSVDRSQTVNDPRCFAKKEICFIGRSGGALSCCCCQSESESKPNAGHERPSPLLLDDKWSWSWRPPLLKRLLLILHPKNFIGTAVVRSGGRINHP